MIFHVVHHPYKETYREKKSIYDQSLKKNFLSFSHIKYMSSSLTNNAVCMYIYEIPSYIKKLNKKK